MAGKVTKLSSLIVLGALPYESVLKLAELHDDGRYQGSTLRGFKSFYYHLRYWSIEHYMHDQDTIFIYLYTYSHVVFSKSILA